MIGTIAIVKVQDGKTADFERAFLELTAAVRANEPGNLVYQLTRSRTDPLTYKVLELYKDEAAVTAHRESTHFRELGAKLGPSLAGPPDVERLDAVE